MQYSYMEGGLKQGGMSVNFIVTHKMATAEILQSKSTFISRCGTVFHCRILDP